MQWVKSCVYTKNNDQHFSRESVQRFPPPHPQALWEDPGKHTHNYQIIFPISDSCQYFSYFYPYIYAVDPILTSHSSQGTYGNTSIHTCTNPLSIRFHNTVKKHLHDPMYSCFQTYFIVCFQYSSLIKDQDRRFSKISNTSFEYAEI